MHVDNGLLANSRAFPQSLSGIYVAVKENMRLSILLCSVSVAGLGALDLSAQTTPDFSGTWRMDVSRSEAAAQGTPIGPVTVAIRQTPDEVRVETTQKGVVQAVRYFPDGTKRVVADETVGTFRWEDRQLVTNLAAYINK